MRPILKNKLYLYLTEFFAGMSVMAVELGASRLLAPYFSSSQIVWTIIIGTIMIAMALGNVYGGRKADKDPNPDKLYRRILIAAVWIGLIPVLGKYIILGISAVMIFSVNANYLIWAAFAACMVIFVFPLFLLGTEPRPWPSTPWRIWRTTPGSWALWGPPTPSAASSAPLCPPL